MYSDAYPDYLRMTALNVPAALLVLGFLFSIDDITGVSGASVVCVCSGWVGCAERQSCEGGCVCVLVCAGWVGCVL